MGTVTQDRQEIPCVYAGYPGGFIYFCALWGPQTWGLGRILRGRLVVELGSKEVGSESKNPEGRSSVCMSVLSFPMQFLSLPLGLLVHQRELAGLPLFTERR